MPGETLAANLDTLSRVSALFHECGQAIDDVVTAARASNSATPNVIAMRDMQTVSEAWGRAGDALGRVPDHVRKAESPGPALLAVEAELTTIRDLLRQQTPG